MIEYLGKNYVRVSTIIKRYSDFSKIDPAVLERKCDVGTRVHAAIADHIDGKTMCSLPDIAGYLDSFSRWRDAIDLDFIESEKRYYCDRYNVTGQIDALVKFPGSDLPVLVDFKTSACENKITWPMQAHIYGHLITENGTPVMPHYLFVKLDKDGKLPKIFKYNLCKNTFSKCIEAIKFYWSNIN